MKSFLTPTYTFTPGAGGAGTVDLSAISDFDIKKLVAIINQTDGVLIYSTASLTKGFTAEAAGIVTLQFATTGMDAGDKLQIIYEDFGQKDSAYSSPVTLSTEQEAKLDAIFTELQLKANLTDTQPVSFAPGAGGASDATLIEVRDEIIAQTQAVDAVANDQAFMSGGIIRDYSTIEAESTVDGVEGDVGRQAVSPWGAVYTLDTYIHQQNAGTQSILGAPGSTAPVDDTTSANINARLQRIAQRITSLIALLPGSLGQKAKADSLAVTLASDQDALPVTGTFFQATQPVSAASLPLPSGAATSAKQDDELTQLTVIDATLTGISAKLPTSVGQKAMAASLPVVISSDQSALSTTQTALTGTFQEDLTVGAGAETFTAPAGAKWCKIQADDTNTVNIRVKIGGTATASSGHQFQPGRSEDFQVAGNISYISESTTGQKLCVTFGA